MLTESFVASVVSLDKPSSKSIHKDAGIFLGEYQPLPSLKRSFKKSSTKPNCLAATSYHVFAAQADKAVVHVYNIERGNQEAIVPFPGKITSLALIGDPEDAGILSMGNEGGRVIMWELYTGRQVSTPAAHLQAIDCMTVDPTYNYLLTGSPDSNVLVWSIPDLLSFSSSASRNPGHHSPFAPIHTFTNHRGPITAIAMGHSLSSANIAISASQDNSCIVWDYRSGCHLHTFLLTSTPLCLALDPADRALYIGQADGGVQAADFYSDLTLEHKFHNSRSSAAPTEPPESDRWYYPSESPSQVTCVAISHDGASLVTGHEDGKIIQWDAANGRVSREPLSELFAPVTNLLMRPISGFKPSQVRKLQAASVVKPRYERSLDRIGVSDTSTIPENYAFNAQFVSAMPSPRFQTPKDTASESSCQIEALMADFEKSLVHPCFPLDFLEEGILANSGPAMFGEGVNAPSASSEKAQKDILELQLRLAETMNACAAYHEQARELDAELYKMQKAAREKKRVKRMKMLKRAKAERELLEARMGKMKNSEDVDEDMEDEYGSSSTDEMTGSE